MPPKPLTLGGYTARRQVPFAKGGDDLQVSCWVLSQLGGPKVAITVVETLTIPESLYEAVKTKLPHDVTLFLAATHTHCAPDSAYVNSRMTMSIPGIARYKPEVLDWYAARIDHCILKALAAPSKSVSQVTESSWLADANRGRRKIAQPDKHVYKLNFGGLSLWNYAAHPTIYDERELHTREDWPGSFLRPGNLFLQGAIGDVSPAAGPSSASENSRVHEMRKKVADSEATAERLVEENPTLQVVHQSIVLAEPVPSAAFVQSTKVALPIAKKVISQFAPRKAQITALTIGKVALLGIPGEPSSLIGNALRSYGLKLGFKQVWVVSHVNGWIGYILTPEDFDQGGYEASLGFYGREQGTRVIAAGERALDKLAQN